MSSKKLSIGIFILTFTLSAGILFSDEARSWIGGYSSEEWEAGEPTEVEKKIYYQWQIDSLKRAVSPRYIRLLDIHKYAESGDILNKGVLFTYSGLHNKSVSICGNFLQWDCKPMRKNRFGIFYTMIAADALDSNYEKLLNYKYKFSVDGLYVADPTNEYMESDGSGSQISLFVLEDWDVDRFAKTVVLEDSLVEEFNLRTVRFKIYLPEIESVSLVGDFNNWNNESDYMIRNPDGSFELDLKLLPGVYHYNFIADGETITDLFNPNVKIRMPSEDKVSELIVPERGIPIEKKF